MTAPETRRVVPWPALIVAAGGVALCLHRYLLNRSLWLDEAMLALNILERPPAALFFPLSFDQVAPPGLLLVVKGAASVFGNSELALRLVPLLAAIGTLVIFPFAVQHTLGARATALGTAVLSTSPSLLYYAQELKQYSTDALAGVLVLWLALTPWPPSRRRGAALLAACLILPWLSQPSVFLLAGMLAAWSVNVARTRDVRALAAVGAGGLGLAFSCVAQWWLLSAQADNPALVGFWEVGFLPAAEGPRAVIRWLRYATPLLGSPVVLTHAGLGSLVLLVGVVAAARMKSGLFWFVASVVAIALAASAARIYPIGGRLLMYALPIAAMLLAAGLDAIWSAGPFRRPVVGAAVAAILLAWPVREAIGQVRSPGDSYFEHLRPVLESMAAASQPDDRVFVYHGAHPAWRYYTDHRGLRGWWKTPVIIGAPHNERGVEESYARDAERLTSRSGRVWLVFSHLWIDPATSLDDRERLTRLIRFRGDEIVCFRQATSVARQLASACAYDIRAAD